MTDKPSSRGASPVGYKRPPTQHQFKKGVSGNPRGRPPKERTQPQRTLSHTQLDEILLKEALRPIQIRENDQVVELPMIQAVLRSLGVAAVKGHHRSQLALAGMVKAVQTAQHEELKELFINAVQYKDHWEKVFADCDRRGVPRPEPVPHPAEIVIDDKRMTVQFNGPTTADEKARWDRMLAQKQESLEEIASLKEQAKHSKKYKSFYEAEIEHERELAELCGCVIPDEATRRRPGFDLQEWREQQPGYRELMTRGRRRHRTGSPRKPKRTG